MMHRRGISRLLRLIEEPWTPLAREELVKLARKNALVRGTASPVNPLAIF
mgnify:CR=1 FL=1